MTNFEARELLPRYAAVDNVDDDVKVYRTTAYGMPKKRNTAPVREETKPKAKRGMTVREKLADIWKKKGLAAVVAVAVYTASVGVITGTIARHNAIVELDRKYQAIYEQQLNDYKNEHAGASIVTGEESLQKAIDADAVFLAEIGQGVLNTYSAADADDAKKVMICALCRVHSNGEFGEFASIQSIQQAVEQENQWWGYKAGLVYTKEVEQIAKEVSAMYHRKQAMPCSANMVYAGWNGTEIVLRDKWKDNSNARHYQ